MEENNKIGAQETIRSLYVAAKGYAEGENIPIEEAMEKIIKALEIEDEKTKETSSINTILEYYKDTISKEMLPALIISEGKRYEKEALDIQKNTTNEEKKYDNNDVNTRENTASIDPETENQLLHLHSAGTSVSGKDEEQITLINEMLETTREGIIENFKKIVDPDTLKDKGLAQAILEKGNQISIERQAKQGEGQK